MSKTYRRDAYDRFDRKRRVDSRRQRKGNGWYHNDQSRDRFIPRDESSSGNFLR